jgi:S1-C subfamily serine protease
LERLGFVNGDILRSVNGVEIADRQGFAYAMAILSKLESPDSSSAILRLTRDGKPLSLTLDLGN